MRLAFPDIGEHGGTLLADRRAMRANGVGPDRSGDDEGLSIVDDEGLEGMVWAFDDGFFAFDKIEDVHGARGVMRNCASEPMAAGFYELERM